MKYLFSAALIAVGAATFGYATTHGQQPSDGPRYTAAGELIRPADFREWMFVTSGLGMTYNPPAPRTGSEPAAPARVPNFTNVYVNPSAYRAFIEASVKDEARFPGKWAYFDFGRQMHAQVQALPPTERCYSCHADHAAVDNTFVVATEH